MPRIEGPYWTGYSAFQLHCEQQQWAILANRKDTRPFLINDTCDPKLPDWLTTSRWGENGYSIWCKTIGAALREAGKSKSRGWRRVNGMDFNQLSEAWWVVFELKLHADQVCDLTNRLKISCNIGQKGVPSWRISEDIHIPNIQRNGGLVPKHIIHGWGKSFFQDYDKFTPRLSISKGDCISCKRHEPLCARQCAQCWNNCVVLPAPMLMTEDAPAPLLEAIDLVKKQEIKEKLRLIPTKIWKGIYI